MLIPDESQNLVAVMSAMTVLTPGVKAEPNCWPARSAVAMSISAGSATITAGNCCGSATGAIPSAGRLLSRGPGSPRRPRPHRAGLRPAAWRDAAKSPLQGVTPFGQVTSLRSGRHPHPPQRDGGRGLLDVTDCWLLPVLWLSPCFSNPKGLL